MKQKFIPLEKLSKRKQKEVHAAQRKDWGAIKPITSRIESAKVYNRSKNKKSKHRWNEFEPGLGFLFAALLIILLLLPITVRATHGFRSDSVTITVEGRDYLIWGYFEDGPVPAFRLRDIAYILNGTDAQFTIRETPDERWDYWIVRGEAYIPTGDELREMPFRSALFGSYGFVSGVGIDSDPLGFAVVGIDEFDGEPDETIDLRVIRDADGIFFQLESLEHILGFAMCYWECWPDFIIETRRDAADDLLQQEEPLPSSSVLFAVIITIILLPLPIIAVILYKIRRK
ncbi:MAG: hypothetical protein FWE90_10925 [Defluviitaleaceae bacterium]|nr:hypothetical protein [Defluviitaleaceae bacterium]